MFATPDDDAVPPDTSATIPGGRSGTGRGRESLALLAERVRPTAASRTRLLPVDPALAALLPEGGLRRGATIVVATRGGAGGGISLSVALLAAASAGGSWCAAVGLPDLGAVALADLGIDLGRFALVHSPGPAWAEATATLFDGIEAVLLCPPFPRARPWPAAWWPGPVTGTPSWWWCRGGRGGRSPPTSTSPWTAPAGTGSGRARATSAGGGSP